jgi:hypothetical protein
MSRTEYEASVELPVSAEQAMAWHERPGAFERLTPPWESVRVVERRGGIRTGDRITLEIRPMIFPLRWELEHVDYQPGRMFCDQQVRGPFRRWRHEHRFEDLPGGRSRLTDHVEYDPPLGLGGGWMASQLRGLFAYRHRITRDDLAAHAAESHRPRMTFAITGAGGLVGRSLTAMLTTGGHRVVKLVRKAGRGLDEACWDPNEAVKEPDKIEGVDAVIHLAGESVAGRWTAARMEAIRRSRATGTQTLVASLLKLKRQPGALIFASAVGYYGSRGDEVVDEHSPAGQGFLPEVAAEWEAASRPAIDAGWRVVHLRLGVVLTPAGGALAKMLPPFKMGLGGVVGHGRQYMPWVSLEDVVHVFHAAVMNNQYRGVYNLTAPEPVSNQQFTRALAAALRRPAILPVPGFAVRAMLGKMGEDLLLGGVRALPRRLMESGYRHRDVDLTVALRWMLGRG